MKRFLKNRKHFQVNKGLLFPFVAVYLLLLTTVVMTDSTNAYYTSEVTVDGQIAADSKFIEDEQAPVSENKDSKNQETEQDQTQDKNVEQNREDEVIQNTREQSYKTPSSDKETEEDRSNEEKLEQEKSSADKTDEQSSSTSDVSEQDGKQDNEHDSDETS